MPNSDAGRVKSRPTEFDELLAQAREAEPGDRITLRDPIAAHGELALAAMTDWLSDPRLAAFSWQWGDGASYCQGGTASTTSEPLKAWLDRSGLVE